MKRRNAMNSVKGQEVESSGARRDAWPSSRGQAVERESARCVAEHQRGQAAVEFFTYVGFFLLVFVGASFLFIQQQGQELKRNEFLFAKEIGSQFADDINFALASGDGFSGNFTCPKTIMDRQYNVTFTSSGFAYVSWNGTGGEATYAYALNTGDFEPKATGAGDPVARTGIDVSKGYFTLQNVNGTIYVDATPE
jgi:hypothetical protein